MLSWLFGDVQENIVHLREKDKSAGYLEFEKARIRWYLSIDENSLRKRIQEIGQRTYRSIAINGEALEFSTGFIELHTESYQQIFKR
jgi:UDP-N-acetyl-2-amino-2-deoxyglucuronate dehydrogenase